jgi:hypothetical protein
MQQVARGYNASRSLVVFSYHGGLYENPKRLLYNKHVMSINEKYCKRWAACLPACLPARLPVCLPTCVLAVTGALPPSRPLTTMVVLAAGPGGCAAKSVSWCHHQLTSDACLPLIPCRWRCTFKIYRGGQFCDQMWGPPGQQIKLHYPWCKVGG